MRVIAAVEKIDIVTIGISAGDRRATSEGYTTEGS